MAQLKIDVGENKSEKEIGRMTAGEVFSHRCYFYMKTNEVGNFDKLRCTQLATGTNYYFGEHEKGMPERLKLVREK